MSRQVSTTLAEDLETVSRLRRLIHRYAAEISVAESRLTSADLLAALYLALRLGTGNVIAHATPLSSLLAKIWPEAQRGVTERNPSAPVGLRELHLFSFDSIPSAYRSTDDALAIMYGLNRRSLGGEWATALGALPNTILLPLFGRSLALWRATSFVIASERTSEAIEAVLDELTLVFNDASFDPLMLSELCERLRLRAITPESGVVYQNDETALALAAKVEALQDEMKHLRHSNAQKQRAIVLLNAAYAERSDA